MPPKKTKQKRKHRRKASKPRTRVVVVNGRMVPATTASANPTVSVVNTINGLDRLLTELRSSGAGGFGNGGNGGNGGGGNGGGGNGGSGSGGGGGGGPRGPPDVPVAMMVEEITAQRNLLQQNLERFGASQHAALQQVWGRLGELGGQIDRLLNPPEPMEPEFGPLPQPSGIRRTRSDFDGSQAAASSASTRNSGADGLPPAAASTRNSGVGGLVIPNPLAQAAASAASTRQSAVGGGPAPALTAASSAGTPRNSAVGIFPAPAPAPAPAQAVSDHTIVRNQLVPQKRQKALRIRGG